MIRLSCRLAFAFAGLVLAIPALAADQERDTSLSLAAFHSTPEESFIEQSEGWMLQLRSTEGRLHFGLELSAQPGIDHGFDYRVPYGTLHETRQYSLYSVGLALHLVPCPTCFISPYVGYSVALGMIRDHAGDSAYSTTSEDYTRIGLGGPVAGVILLPRGMFSLFFEVREQGLVYGDLMREETVSIDMLGQRTVAQTEVTLESRYAVAGIRVNY